MKRTIGVCYYPEHWPKNFWKKDAKRMAEAGLSWVRIGEFAWSKMEPSPGDIKFDWLDEIIDILGTAGLSVVLGTPTATPPAPTRRAASRGAASRPSATASPAC